MHGTFPHPELPLVVYTDLDGSLLDHNTYSCEAAKPAIQRLCKLNIPIIPVTSKTLCEVEHFISTELQIRTPVIAENGGVIAFPSGYFPVLKNFRPAEKYVVQENGPDYAYITELLSELRQKYGFVFYGFKDMCESQISELTGLTAEESARAKWRRSSEPLLWRDNESNLRKFKTLLTQLGLTTTQGGRFMHIMGSFDKGQAMQNVDRLFSRFGLCNHTSLALGDSPNDLPMLHQADVSVAIKRFDGSQLLPVNGSPTFLTNDIGPHGWNEFMMKYLDLQLANTAQRRTAHG